MITLTIGETEIDLPAGLIWEDEFKWTPVTQTAEVAINGALIVQEGAQQGGRPITLSGGDDACWIARSDLETLYAAMQTAGQEMTLTLHDDREFDVMWRRDSHPIEASQLLRTEEPGDGTWYVIEKLKLIEI
jgi:hypothetical protein